MNKLIAVLGGLSVAQAALPAGFPATCNDDAGYVVCPDNTDLTGVSMVGTGPGTNMLDLRNAVLRGATFKWADIIFVNFHSADLSGTTWMQLDTFESVSFKSANLEGATLEQACGSCNFMGTNLLHGTIHMSNHGADVGAETCLTQGCGADMCASALATQCPTCPVCPDTNGFIDPSDAGELANAVRANPTAYQQAGLCM